MIRKYAFGLAASLMTLGVFSGTAAILNGVDDAEVYIA
jgi:hypothetical protein